MALRKGFVRYAFSIQYHGSSFLGFHFNPQQENCILADGTDLRGYRSVEGRLRDALEAMLGDGNRYENIRVSSRTDRGVHAWKNTCHVDICSAQNNKTVWDGDVLRRGLNYFLSQQGAELLKQTKRKNHKTDETTMERQQHHERYLYRRARRKMDSWTQHYPMNELRILKVVQAPLLMQNKFKTNNDDDDGDDQPDKVEWNVRFSANQRTYVYRILTTSSADDYWAVPFEWDRSWRILPSKAQKKDSNNSNGWRLDIPAMQQAATHFLGTHDFSSFRNAQCQRASPVVTIKEIDIASQPYGEPFLWISTGSLFDDGSRPQLVTIKVVGSAFVYRQVRNMVGALVAVGRGTIPSDRIKDILEAQDRTIAPPMAPAHGLFLVDVQHDDIDL